MSQIHLKFAAVAFVSIIFTLNYAGAVQAASLPHQQLITSTAR